MVFIDLSEEELRTLTGALVDSYLQGISSEKKKYQALHDKIQDVRKREKRKVNPSLDQALNEGDGVYRP